MGALARGRASNAACLSEIPGPYLGGRYAGLPEPGSLSVAVSYYYYYYYYQPGHLNQAEAQEGGREPTHHGVGGTVPPDTNTYQSN